eukprot:6202667-Pleurochrysis_carterae.AAC.1
MLQQVGSAITSENRKQYCSCLSSVPRLVCMLHPFRLVLHPLPPVLPPCAALPLSGIQKTLPLSLSHPLTHSHSHSHSHTHSHSHFVAFLPFPRVRQDKRSRETPNYARDAPLLLVHAGGIWGWHNRGPQRPTGYSLGMRQARAGYGDGARHAHAQARLRRHTRAGTRTRAGTHANARVRRARMKEHARGRRHAAGADCAHALGRTRTLSRKRKQARQHICASTRTRARMRTRTRKHMRKHTHGHVNTHTHTDTHARAHTHAH